MTVNPEPQASLDGGGQKAPVLVAGGAPDFSHASGAILPTLDKDRDLDGPDDQALLGACRNLSNQLFQAIEDFGGAVGVDRAQAAGMAGVPRFQHRQRRSTFAHFPDDDTVGSQ